MNPLRLLSLAVALAMPAASLLANTPPASVDPAAALPELANATLPELRDALNDVSDQSIQAARHASDLATELDAAVADSTVSTPEIDELRARRDALLKELNAAEMALRAAILRSDEFKERAAEAAAAREKANALAARRGAIRALLSQRRTEASRPAKKAE